MVHVWSVCGPCVVRPAAGRQGRFERPARRPARRRRTVFFQWSVWSMCGPCLLHVWSMCGLCTFSVVSVMPQQCVNKNDVCISRLCCISVLLHVHAMGRTSIYYDSYRASCKLKCLSFPPFSKGWTEFRYIRSLKVLWNVGKKWLPEKAWAWNYTPYKCACYPGSPNFGFSNSWNN